MQIFVTDIAPPHARVQANLYTALELLRLCCRKIDMALATLDAFEIPAEVRARLQDYDDGKCDVDADHLEDIRSVCIVASAILQEVCTGVPLLSDRVFRELMAYRGFRYNPPHLDGLAMMMELAARHLEEALHLSAELDGEDVDDAFRLMKAIRLQIGSEANCLETSLRGAIDDEALERILRGTTRELAHAERNLV